MTSLYDLRRAHFLGNKGGNGKVSIMGYFYQNYNKIN